MNIAVDLRSLQNNSISGVENYVLNLLDELLSQDKRNVYILFFNSVKQINLPVLNFINVKIVRTRFPNKLLNLLFKFRLLKLENLIGDFDVLFMPNLNIINVKKLVKIVITAHDLSFARCPEFYDIKRLLWHKFLQPKQLFKQAFKILAVSKFTKQDLVQCYNLNPDKIEVIYPGTNQTIYSNNQLLRETRNLYKLPKDYFLFLNTLEPRKNLVGIIKAFEYSNVREHLVIAGKVGWKTRQIMNAIKNNSKKDKIHYLGYVDEDHKSCLIKMATALLYPSFYEGFGFQVLEAMVVGTPAVISQVSALPEVAGDSALLVNPQNSRDLILAMENLSTSEPLRNILSDKGSLRVKNFTWENCAKLTLSALCV